MSLRHRYLIDFGGSLVYTCGWAYVYSLLCILAWLSRWFLQHFCVCACVCLCKCPFWCYSSASCACFFVNFGHASMCMRAYECLCDCAWVWDCVFASTTVFPFFRSLAIAALPSHFLTTPHAYVCCWFQPRPRAHVCVCVYLCVYEKGPKMLAHSFWYHRRSKSST